MRDGERQTERQTDRERKRERERERERDAVFALVRSYLLQIDIGQAGMEALNAALKTPDPTAVMQQLNLTPKDKPCVSGWVGGVREG